MGRKSRATPSSSDSSQPAKSPHSGEEVRPLEAELKQAHAHIARLCAELEESTRCLERQTDVARRFQNLFNPPALPHLDGIAFSVRYQPCPRVGGDLYDVFDMGNSCVGILVADIAGYGLGAVLITALAKMTFDTFRQNEYSPKAILDKVNEHLLRHTLGNQFLTAFMGVLDLETLRMKYVNAAHPRAVVFGPERFELLDTDGLCCGMFEEPHYEEKQVQLASGDRMMFFTRGLLDMCSGEGEHYRHLCLHELFEQNRETPLADLMHVLTKDIDRHLAGGEQTEDLTLVAVELTHKQTPANCIVIPSEPQQLRRVEQRILARMVELNYGERALFGVRLAIEEAVINAIKHGNKMDKSKNVAITYSVDDHECVISIEDEGEGFDPNAVPDPTTDDNIQLPHGRGLVLMQAYMDDVSHNQQGNCVTLRKRAPWAS